VNDDAAPGAGNLEVADDLIEQYAVAFDGRLAPGDRLAVLVVDLVRAYLDDGSPLQMDTAAAARDSTGRIVEAARAAGVPVIWTAVRYASDGSDGGRFFQKVPSLAVFADGAGDLGDFPAEVSPADGEQVVVKQYPSAFFGTDLADDLHAQGIDTLLIAGYSTSGCVRASALDALCHGFVPLVVREACADRDPRPHTSALFDLQAKYAEVIDEPTALRVLTA
jgi:maleamate amidohydrolase